MINIPSNEYWGNRSGALDKNFGSSQSKNYFQYYFQQMQWTKAKSGNNGKTGWKAKRVGNYRNKKLDRHRGYL